MTAGVEGRDKVQKIGFNFLFSITAAIVFTVSGQLSI